MPRHYVRVADGTLVSAFLNGTDALGGVARPLCAGVSIAAGIIEAGVASRIHVMPLVTQITWVNAGQLQVRMREAGAATPYALALGPGQACVTQPGTLLQLLNTGADPCHVLYIVSPFYLVELASDGSVAYDDAIVLGESWESLDNGRLTRSRADLATLAAHRDQVLRRLTAKTGDGVNP